MNTLRVIYHLARADFLERVRRYSFLLMLGLVVWLGYLSASGQFPMWVSPDYVGITNSAWAGGIMTITVSMLLSLVGFYIVKGSVNRDYTTGVGQIMATTPLSRPAYMFGKWLSNFSVLGIAILILMLAGIVMTLLAGAGEFDLWALVSPLLFIALPCMGLVAAIAVLFESISWLRGGLGNVVYFFVFMVIMSIGSMNTINNLMGIPTVTNPYTDIMGNNIIGDSVAQAAKAAYPESTGVLSFMGGASVPNPKYFTWEGMTWTSDILLSRLIFLLIAAGLVLASALFFDRFNPSHLLLIKRTKPASASPEPVADSAAKPSPNVRLTPINGTRGKFRFGALFLAELKLFLKGQRWWWYAIAAGLTAAQLVTPLETTRTLLLLAWLWPILILSGLGCRENRFDTRQIVFAAPHPIANQLPAAWLTASVVTAVLGSGALIKFILMGETVSILGWLTGVVFIPSLALALGTLTGSGKAFEAVYVVWMYAIYQRVSPLDFMGMTPNSRWYFYTPLALILLAIAALARQRQLTAKSIAR
ncbi:MAG: hypothetical protein HGA82_01260 [Anaerolineales bacterium]|nr:hypothetical protein [Anaerolineales bacterium]